MKHQNLSKKTFNANKKSWMAPVIMTMPAWIPLLGIILPETAYAVQEDTLKAHTTVIEGFLTGNLLRMSVLGGTVWGAVQSYMAGKFMILASTLGIGLGTFGILSWAKATWAFVI